MNWNSHGDETFQNFGKKESKREIGNSLMHHWGQYRSLGFFDFSLVFVLV